MTTSNILNTFNHLLQHEKDQEFKRYATVFVGHFAKGLTEHPDLQDQAAFRKGFVALYGKKHGFATDAICEQFIAFLMWTEMWAQCPMKSTNPKDYKLPTSVDFAKRRLSGRAVDVSGGSLSMAELLKVLPDVPTVTLDEFVENGGNVESTTQEAQVYGPERPPMPAPTEEKVTESPRAASVGIYQDSSEGFASRVEFSPDIE